MNETVNEFLLTGDKFMPEMHLRSLLRLVSLDLFIVFVDPLQKTNKKKNSKI